MNNYELLVVLPGTLAENETAPIVEKVKQLLLGCQAVDLTIKDEGKSRLAYPMLHIRYGYFYLVHFKSETANVKIMEAKLRLMSELLRALITKKTTKAGINKINFASAVVHQDDRVMESTPTSYSAGRRFNNDHTHTTPVAPVKVEVKTDFDKDSVQGVKETPVVEVTEESVVPELVVEEVIAKEEKPAVKRHIKKTDKVTLDDIDKKLDEILDLDLEKV